MPQKAVIYCRVSTKEQLTNQSLAVQLTACERYCADRDIKVSKVFMERGESAKTINRPQIGLLMQFCAKHKDEIDFVVVHKLDRLARDVADFATLSNLMKALNIKFVATAESFGTDIAGMFTQHILAAAAQFENDMRSERSRNGLRATAEQGQWNHPPPAGYNKPGVKGGLTLVPDPTRASFIRDAFEWMASGRYSIAAVKDKLNAMGFVPRRGNAVGAQAVKNILTNPIYKGRIVESNGDVNVVGRFEPLVTESTWAAAQVALNRTKKKSTPRRLNNPAYSLRRFVRCAHHNSPITGSFSKGRNGRFGYYRCRTSGCVSIRKETFEALFVDALQEVRPNKEVVSLFLDVVRDVHSSRREKVLESQQLLKRRIKGQNKRRQRAVDLLIDGTLNAAVYKSLEQQVDSEINNIQAQLYSEKVPDENIENLLYFTQSVLTHPAELWRGQPIKVQQALQTLVFPRGITYNGESFGTADCSVVFDVLGDQSPRNTNMVGHTGFEPLTSIK